LFDVRCALYSHCDWDILINSVTCSLGRETENKRKTKFHAGDEVTKDREKDSFLDVEPPTTTENGNDCSESRIPHKNEQ